MNEAVMSTPERMKPKLDALAESINRTSVFSETQPLQLDAISLQDHLTLTTIEALAELKTIARELVARSDRDVPYARRIIKAQVSLKLISQLFLERREKERREAEKPDRRKGERRQEDRKIE